jgi:hypothetical protein
MTSKKAVARLLWLVLVLVLCVYLNSNVWAQDDGETGTLNRTIVVHPMSTGPQDSGTELLEAMANITNASATNPWLIKLDAGVFDLGTSSLVMKPYVDIEGSGEGVTTITAVTNQTTISGTVVGASNSELRFLTVVGTTARGWAVAFTANQTSPRLTQVTLTATVPPGPNTAIGLQSIIGSPVLTEVTVEMPTGGQRLRLQGGEVVRDSTIMIGPGFQSWGVLLSNFSASQPSVIIENTDISSADVGIFEQLFGLASVNHSTVMGVNHAISGFATQTTVKIGVSQIVGGVATAGVVTCVGDYDGNYVPLNSSCQNPPSLTSITPNTGVRGTSVNVTLTGTGLSGVTSISMSGTGVTVSGLTVPNSTTVTATFTIAPTASLGARNVILTTPGVAINPVVTFTVN